MNVEQMSRRELIEELKKLLDSSTDEVREKIVDDLRVHQVELELQNRELRDAQSALEASRARFEELYDFAPVAYFTFDPDGVVLGVNLTGAMMIERDRASLIGRPFTSLVTMAEPSVFIEHLRSCERGRRSVVTQMRFAVDATERDVQAVTVPVLDAMGHAIAFRTSFNDITQLKRTEAELARATHDEQQLRQRFEQLNHTAFLVGLALARVADAPVAVSELLQLMADQARTVVDVEIAAIGIASGPDRPFDVWVSSGLDAASAADTSRPPRAPALLEVPIRFASRVVGSLYLAKKRTGEELSADDRRVVEMFADRAGVALAIARLGNQLRDSVAARDNLLAIVSHDLRGSLTSIRLSVELLKRGREDDVRQQRALDAIDRASSQMAGLIEDLLQAAAIETGTFTIDARPHDPAPLIDEAVALLEPRADERSIQIDREIAPALPAILCDDRRVVQVLCNLIGNAIRFVAVGGRVVVSARADGGEVRFAVADNGPGIAEDKISLVFERYWKGKSEHGSTGLGLYIARGIVTAHGGRIWVDSRVGAGSTFYFTIPRA